MWICRNSPKEWFSKSFFLDNSYIFLYRNGYLWWFLSVTLSMRSKGSVRLRCQCTIHQWHVQHASFAFAGFVMQMAFCCSHVDHWGGCKQTLLGWSWMDAVGLRSYQQPVSCFAACMRVSCANTVGFVKYFCLKNTVSDTLTFLVSLLQMLKQRGTFQSH